MVKIRFITNAPPCFHHVKAYLNDMNKLIRYCALIPAVTLAFGLTTALADDSKLSPKAQELEQKAREFKAKAAAEITEYEIRKEGLHERNERLREEAKQFRERQRNNRNFHRNYRYND